eukprot:scaffold111843_cov32-Tisochrysis_lutea.AAC.5
MTTSTGTSLSLRISRQDPSNGRRSATKPFGKRDGASRLQRSPRTTASPERGEERSALSGASLSGGVSGSCSGAGRPSASASRATTLGHSASLTHSSFTAISRRWVRLRKRLRTGRLEGAA